MWYLLHSFNTFDSFMQGEVSFFLQPGETLEQGIQSVFILGEDEGLILRAQESFKDANAVSNHGWYMYSQTCL